MAQTNMPIIGIDIGDTYSHYCVLDACSNEVIERGRIRTTPAAVAEFCGSRPTSLIVMEVGTHSPWLSRLVMSTEHSVIVANPRRLALIYKDARKSDPQDAEYLARLGRVDPKLLSPIRHRRLDTQLALGLFRARDALVESRTKLVNTVRSLAKSLGVRIRKTATKCFEKKAREDLTPELLDRFGPLVDSVEHLSLQIRGYEQRIDELGEKEYPETSVLRQVQGVGMLTSLAYILTLEDPDKFKKNRDAGAYLGMAVRRDQSGSQDKELGITKAGDPFVRRLLVQSAHYILGHRGQDSDLRRWGLALVDRGGKGAKKRAVVAVARKLAVLLLALWRTGEVYEPLRNSKLRELETAGV